MNRETQTWNPVPFCLNCCINRPLTDPLSTILKIKAFYSCCSLKSLLLSDYLMIFNPNAFTAAFHHVLTCANQYVPVLLGEIGQSLLAGSYSLVKDSEQK